MASGLTADAAGYVVRQWTFVNNGSIYSVVDGMLAYSSEQIRFRKTKIAWAALNASVWWMCRYVRRRNRETTTLSEDGSRELNCVDTHSLQTCLHALLSLQNQIASTFNCSMDVKRDCRIQGEVPDASASLSLDE